MASIKLIQYSEDQWYKYSPEEQQEVKDTWVKKWLPVEDFHRIVLKLIPDPIFPRSEKELPYIEWQYDLAADRKPPELFTVNAAIFVTLSEGLTTIGVPLRNKIEAALAAYPNGTKFQVVTNDGKTSLLQGKVLK